MQRHFFLLVSNQEILQQNLGKMLKIKQLFNYSNFLKIKIAAMNVILIFAAWLVAFILCVIAKVIFDDASDNLMNFNPFVNGFIHADISHLLMNLGLLFVFFLPKVNQAYRFKKIFVITTLISFCYLPVSLATGIPAVGVSGTLYFMMSRACLNRRNLLLYLLFLIVTVPELIQFLNFHDGNAHIVHIIGALLGLLSLWEKKVDYTFIRLLNPSVKNEH